MLAATFGNSWRLPGYEVRLLPACPLFPWGPQEVHTGSRTHREPGNCCVMTTLGASLMWPLTSLSGLTDPGSSFSGLGLSLCHLCSPEGGLVGRPVEVTVRAAITFLFS